MNLLQTIESQFKKPAVVAVKTGDSVRVHQRVREGSRQRVQIFEGLVIRVDRKQSLTYRITVRRIASGVGVEKGFMMHSTNVVRVEVVKRAKVRRNYISYIRQLRGKSTRLKGLPFDSKAVNLPAETAAEAKPAANSTGNEPGDDEIRTEPADKARAETDSKAETSETEATGPNQPAGENEASQDQPADKPKS